MSYVGTGHEDRDGRAPSGGRAPAEHVLQLLSGFWHSQIIVVLSRLRVADELAAGPRSARDLAAAVGVHPDALLRLLRAAATVGLMTETEPDHYRLTDAGECLRSDSPTALRELAVAYGSPTVWRLVGEFEQSVRTGEPVAPALLGRSFWEHLAANPEEAEHFALGMGEQSAQVAADVAAAVDPSAYGRLVDVGGAYGVLLAALLDKAPSATGVLLDRPPVIEAARQRLWGSPLAGRIDLVAGDFLEEVPKGDLYLLKWILHDWDDEHAVRILATCRRSAAPGARLLLVEMLLPEPWTPSHVHLSDLAMLVLLGGRERTASQYGDLLRAGGWEPAEVTPTSGRYSILQAVATP
ncbi:acetylserotonin O-methyltransferase [Nonomuraea gerenzanensis]|uniref:O-methyltransferase n=1 Tax=Nonomuraea gerenzanensis TaxID=93944 RepID=A0A1M4E5E1_9ACTN|nr:acetylserotonin O-methyltransferase [Nonomuraea gerenzanensis]UBU16260.1 acetylserotonin O-methyltransferase [Nonomuraea gerenzanensis]SBO94075.1 O-methyltransferase [Nonomuraea gerenzanensis]